MIASKLSKRPFGMNQTCEYCGGRYQHLAAATCCSECHSVFWLHPAANYLAKMPTGEIVVMAFDGHHPGKRAQIVCVPDTPYVTRVTVQIGKETEEWPATMIVLPIKAYQVAERYSVN